MSDIDELMAVMDCAFDPQFGEAWTKRQVEDALKLGNCEYLLICGNGEKISADSNDGKVNAAGFYLSRHIITDTELLLLAVDPACRQRGLGGVLLDCLATNARARGSDRIFLEMRRDNPAESLYRHFGFVPVGERRNYYRMPGGQRVDAITFAMSI